MQRRDATSYTHKGFDISRLRARRIRERAERAATARRLNALVREIVPPIVARRGAETAYLFGSIPDGNARGDSDVDLVVMGVAPADYWALRRELEKALGRPVDLHTQDDEPAFVTKAIARGQRIYGQDS